MDSIHLSPRLQMVADFVPPCACAADIGTDHGYLPVWLLQNGVIQTAIAADIHVGPLANARKSAAAYDLEERVRFVQADGLQFPDAQEADVITIAGMGGETICAILAATPWLRQGKRLVLQPQSKVQELTDWLWHNGFTIEDAALCRDAGKRPREIFIAIRHNRISIFRVDIFIAIGAHHQRPALRLENADHVFDKRHIFKRNKPLIDSAHAASFAAGQNQTRDVFFFDPIVLHRFLRQSFPEILHRQSTSDERLSR